MGDFSQNGIISTLHDFGTKSTSTIEKELLKHSAERKMELILPSLYSELEGTALPKIVEEEATKTIETLETNHYSHGISPNALLGATLYLACKKMKVRRSQLEIAKVVGTSEVTLRNRSKQIFTLLNSK